MEKQPADRTQKAPSFKEMELEDITSKISALDKWRAIFGSQGLKISRPDRKTIQDNYTGGEENEDRSKTSRSKKHGTSPGSVLYSIPRELIISSDLGGRPITIEMAMELRKILFGNTFQTFNYEWKKSFFKFREAFSNLAYALEAEK
ncbi:unnamed protein product, partial [Staurois parvus]